MAGFFNYENKFMSGLNKLYDGMLLSFLWLICSLPVITMGASFTALYYAVNKSIRHNRGYAWKEFFKAFKSNFKQSTIVWIINLVLLIVGALDCYILNQVMDTMTFAKIVMVIIVAFLIFLLMWMAYVYPYMARFALPTKALMKNCAIIAMANFHWSFLLVLLVIVSAVLTYYVAVIAVFVPVIYMVIANRIIEKVFRKYMSDEDIEAEDERYRDDYN